MKKKAKEVPEGAINVTITKHKKYRAIYSLLNKDQILAAKICSEDCPRYFYLLLVDWDWICDYDAAFLDADRSPERPG
jgi:hypothetical protein